MGVKLGCLTSREQKLRAFENRVLRRISGHKREEVTEGQRKLHNEELCNLHSPGISSMMKSTGMRWAEHVAQER
jgi:hypothetical protein